MFQRFICCFKPKKEMLPVIYKNMEEINTSKQIDNSKQSNNSKQIIWKHTIEFVAPIEQGFVIKVYDGDTITIASKLPYDTSPLYRFSVRLNGIDCPEIKGKDENEKECAQIAKKELNDLIMNKMVTLKNIQTEKYGRILADVYIGDLHLNQHMIEKRLAVAYDGGTKMKPTNWMNYYCKGEM
jgi:micrococcal nuclease